MVGHDIIEKPPTLGDGGQKFVHINFYPADIDEIYKPAVEVIGDISYSFWTMAEQITVQNWEFGDMLKYREYIQADIRDMSDTEDFPLKPQRLVRELREVLPKDGILSLDNGMYKLWIARNYPAYEQNSVLLDNALATMGAGLPVGMAAKLLNPGKKVVVVAGDGGFVMNLADLETAQRLQLDLVVVVLTDNGFGMIKWKQAGMALPDFGLEFGNPDFVKLAESFGATGYRITKAADFRPTLEAALAAKGVHIIDLPIDYSENVKLSPAGLRAKVSALKEV
jgi:acetolactate synthase-1/2/3 large subunit